MKKNSQHTNIDDNGLPVLLKAEDLAKMLGKSRDAIYAMNSRKKIPGAFKITERDLYFRKDAVLRWIEAGSRA